MFTALVDPHLEYAKIMRWLKERHRTSWESSETSY